MVLGGAGLAHLVTVEIGRPAAAAGFDDAAQEAVECLDVVALDQTFGGRAAEPGDAPAVGAPQRHRPLRLDREAAIGEDGIEAGQVP